MTLGRDRNKRNGAASSADNARTIEMFGRLSTRLEELQSSLDRLNDDVRETLQRLDGELHEVRSFVSEAFEENARYATEAAEIPREKIDSKSDEGPDWLERGGSRCPDVRGESGPSRGQYDNDDEEDDWLEGPSSAMPSEPPDRDSAYLGSSPSGGFRGSETGDIESDLSSLLEDSDWGDDEEDFEIEDRPPRSSPKRTEEESWSLDDEGLDIEDEPPPRSRTGRASGPQDRDRDNQAELRGYRPSGSEEPRSTSRRGRRRKPRQNGGGRKEAGLNGGNRRSYEESGRKGSRSSRRRKQERRTKARRQRSQVEGLTGRRRPPQQSRNDARPPREQVEEFDSLLNDYLADDE